MSFRVVTLLSDASAIEQVQDKLLGYPLAGVHFGGGVHVDMPVTWDGTGTAPPGWSSYRGSSKQHPTLLQFAIPIDPDASNAMGNGRRARLSALEQTKMAADLAAAIAQLPVDWSPSVVQVAKGDETGRT